MLHGTAVPVATFDINNLNYRPSKTAAMLAASAPDFLEWRRHPRP
jgi:hypothetical protein